MDKSPRVLGALAMLVVLWSSCVAPAGEVVARRTAKPPTVDGALDEPCWAAAAEKGR